MLVKSDRPEGASDAEMAMIDVARARIFEWGKLARPG